jgi:hypothetical protein
VQQAFLSSQFGFACYCTQPDRLFRNYFVVLFNVMILHPLNWVALAPVFTTLFGLNKIWSKYGTRHVKRPISISS